MNKKLLLTLLIATSAQAETVFERIQTMNLSDVPASSALTAIIKEDTKDEARRDAENSSFKEKDEKYGYLFPATLGITMLSIPTIFACYSNQVIDFEQAAKGIGALIGATTLAGIREHYRLEALEPRYQAALQRIADRMYPQLLNKNLANNTFARDIKTALQKLAAYESAVVELVYQQPAVTVYGSFEPSFDKLCHEVQLTYCTQQFPLIHYVQALTEIVKNFNHLVNILENTLNTNDKLSSRKRVQIEQCITDIKKENILCKNALMGIKKTDDFIKTQRLYEEHLAAIAKLEREKAEKAAAEQQAAREAAQMYAAHQQAQTLYAQQQVANQQWWNDFWNNLNDKDNRRR